MTTEDRLEILEKELSHARNRIRWLLAGAALVVGTSVFCATTGGVKEVRASAFTLVDRYGKPRASLSMQENGPAFSFGMSRASTAPAWV